jgi:hypothetical protein
VRIEDVRERVHEVLEHVVARDLVRALEHALVALAQHVARVVPLLVGEPQRHDVVLDALAPELVELGARFRPRRVLAVELEVLVDREIGLVLELRERNCIRSRLRVWKRLKIANAGSSSPVVTASSSWAIAPNSVMSLARK